MTTLNRVIRALVACSPLAVAACASGPAAPPPIIPPVASVESDAGTYKIGKPYQVEGVWYYPAEDYAYVQEGIASWYGADFHGKRTANGDRYDMNALTAAHPTLPMPSLVKITNLDNGQVLKVTVNDRGPFHSRRIIDVSRRAAELLGFYEAGTARVRVEIDPEESLNLKNMALAKFPPEMPQVAAAPRGMVSALALAPLPADSTAVPAAAVKPVAVPRAAVKPPASKAATAKQPASGGALQSATANARGGSGIFIQAGAFSEEANARRLEQQMSELGAVRIVPTTVNSKKMFRVQLGPLADAAAATAMLSKIKSFGYDDAKLVRE